MPVYGGFQLLMQEDAIDTFSMSPPTSISGWSMEVYISKRFGTGSSGLIVASMASGYSAGQSGMTLANGANGTLTFPIHSPQTSGWQAGNYATTINRTDSGYSSCLFAGYLMLLPR